MAWLDGAVSPSDGVIEDVEDHGHLVIVGGAIVDDGNYQFEVRQAVTFEERAGRTELREPIEDRAYAEAVTAWIDTGPTGTTRSCQWISYRRDGNRRVPSQQAGRRAL